MASRSKKVILTGMRPTGPLHIGHLLGALTLWETLQTKYDSYFLIADWQVLSEHMEKRTQVPQFAREMVADWIAAGLDPQQSTFVLQSHVPQLAELTFYFYFLVTVARARRNPTVKEEAKNVGLSADRDDISLGFLGYPVSQAADILLFKANLVPVGEDQAPHIEQTREVARTFNRLFGDTFPEPECMFTATPRVAGLDGRKMSKSLNNSIYLKDSDDEIIQKIKRAKTDSLGVFRYDHDGQPELANLINLYRAFTTHKVDAIEKKYMTAGYGKFKEDLAKAIIKKIAPIRARREELLKKPAQLDTIIKKGTKKAMAVAERTIKEVRSKVFPYTY